ncbi:MAG: adenylate/guanylate cyclase domain-containing protein [Acidimicrobiia bacterium]|nr:adenylate/guanylate cyclase domain-containing protein [Acidimicrobiia bacterium]
MGDEPSALEVLLGAEEYRTQLPRFALLWSAPIAIGVTISVLAAGDHISSITRVVLIGTVLATGFLFVAVTHFLPRTDWIIAAALTGALLVPVCLAVVGPEFAIGATAISAVSAMGFVVLSRRGAFVVVGAMLVGLTVVVSTIAGYPRPITQVAAAATFSAASSIVMHNVIAEVQRLARELAAANARLGQYVAPQVAAAVGRASDLEPHRRLIAVWFCDLRGFTRFSAGAEPEDVVHVLGEYYAAVGDRATAAGATIGTFAGDGIHGYFGDPAPRTDADAAALDLALDLRPALDALCARWADRGFALGYGIGIAYGYATLGTVGYEGRRDYTALGSVVNLAARLCGEAASGEIILDARAHDGVKERVGARRRDVELKGFTDVVRAYVVEPAPRA